MNRNKLEVAEKMKRVNVIHIYLTMFTDYKRLRSTLLKGD